MPARPPLHFNHSRLIRFLAERSLIAVHAPGPAFAERLGQWLDFKDAMTLYAAQNTARSSPPNSTPPRSAHPAEELARVRTALTQAIINNCTTGATGSADGRGRLRLPALAFDLHTDVVLAFAPYQRFYLANQRELATQLRALRAQLRHTLWQESAALKRLATLDAAFDDILRDREDRLLATMPRFLQERLAHLLAEQRQQQQQGADDDVNAPDTWMQEGGWLAGYCRELQIALLAELEHRLQPALGLVAAFNNETSS